MKRRQFITLLGGAAAAWPLAARAQQDGRVRRIGWLVGGAENDVGLRASRAALREALVKFGWIEGRNLRIDLRFGAGDAERIRDQAAELVRLAPDVIVTDSGPPTNAVQLETQTIPIIFTSGGDPVVTGRVRNIARPEGNITGFSTLEPSIAGKWLELLKEAAPFVGRVAVIFNPDLISSAFAASYMSAIDLAASVLGIRAIKTSVRSAVKLVRAIDLFATEPNGGLLFLPPTLTTATRDIAFELTAEYRLPSIYTNPADAAAGGLLAYSSDRPELSRQAASYIDRILRGAKINDLPVQFPTKYELVVNLKTAKSIGLTISEAFLLRADEVIE